MAKEKAVGSPMRRSSSDDATSDGFEKRRKVAGSVQWMMGLMENWRRLGNEERMEGIGKRSS